MRWLRFFRRDRWDAERARELTSYIQIETDENIARGMTPEAARTAAYRKLGNPTLIREQVYDMNSLGFLETTWHDLRYGARTLRRNPGFALVAILSLALGIGANTAIFQLIDAVRLRALPVDAPDRLAIVRIGETPNGRTGRFSGRYPTMTYPLWEQVDGRLQSFEGVFAWGGATFDLAVSGESRPVQGMYVTEQFYSTLGVTPAAGRLPVPSDTACADSGVVISYPFWQREYGADAAAIGRTISIDGRPFPIVGVTEQTFFGLEVGRQFDLALPMCAQPLLNPADNALTQPSWWWLGVMGRLKPGVSLEQATAELQAVSPGMFESTVPPNYNVENANNYRAFRLAARPAEAGISSLRTQYGDSLTLLLAIAGLVLLIACGNLANLMLARASTRRREMAVRLAIGASRRRLVRQLMAESLLVALAGAVLGAWVAGLLGQALVSFIETPSAPLFVDIAPSWRMAAFATGLAVLTCLGFGLAPALRATRTQPGAALGSRGETDPSGRFNLRRMLVVGQLAVSLVLLVGAMLFVLTFHNVANIDPGIETETLLVAEFDYRRAGVADDAHASYQREFIERLAALPGVGQISRVAVVPLTGSGWNQALFIDGKQQTGYPHINRVDGNYFAVVGSSIVSGRTFDSRDVAGAPSAAVVTEKFVEQYLAGRDPIGRTFHFDVAPGEPPTIHTVVGVARNARYSDIHDDVSPMVYLAAEQEAEFYPGLSVIVRPDVPSDAATAALVAAARERPGMLATVTSLEDTVEQTLVRERLMAALAGFFGVLAAALAAIGLYGVMSYTVSRRRQEIGVRMALGAGRGRILRMVLGEAAVMVAAGVAVGGVLSAIGARYTQSLLFGLTATDVRIIGAAAALLALVAVLASLWPAQRAARLEPTMALRDG